MFVKLAFKNIKRSIKDYAIYFFTLVLGVAIFYVFNSLASQTVMLDVNERVKEMVELLSIIMGVVSVFVAVILGALIIYASRFLIKRRSKEFGVYLTLGMSKRKISIILLLETFFIGLFSLGVGLLLGIIVSQFTSVLVANMFEANLTKFQFVFSLGAFLKTILYFGVIYLIVMFFNTINISRQKLINLLSSSRRNEKIKMKNLWLCTVVFIIACIILGLAYYLVTDGIDCLMNEDVEVLLIPIGMGIVATFLLFWSLSGILLRIFMGFKNIYYRGLNSFILRQFSSKINTTVVSMTMICLMLFVTICILGSAVSINNTMRESTERALPVDIQIGSIGNRAIDIREAYRTDNINVDDYLQDQVSFHTYMIDDFDMEDSLGDVMQTLDPIAAAQASATVERFIKVSDYNKVAPKFQLPAIELKKDEYAILANYKQILTLRNQALAKDTPIKVQGKTLHPNLDHCIEGDIELQISNLNTGIIIIPDDIKLTGEDISVRSFLLGDYKDQENGEAIEQKLMSLNNRFFNDTSDDDDTDKDTQNDKNDNDDSTYQVNLNSPLYYYNVTSRQSIIDNNVGTSALVTFIGLYLGIIFLISSAAVLALKELSESSDNRDKYNILRKIGASEKMLHRALFWQIFIFFLFPLLIAILHSIFGLRFCNFILNALGGINISEALPWVTGFLLLIYGGYFLLTYICSKSMIRPRRG